MKWKFHVVYHTRCFFMPLSSLIFQFCCTIINTKTKQNHIRYSVFQVHSTWRAFSTYSLEARVQTGISVHWPTPSLHLDKDFLFASQNLFATRAWQLMWEEARTLRESHRAWESWWWGKWKKIYTADIERHVRTKGQLTAGSHIRVR